MIYPNAKIGVSGLKKEMMSLSMEVNSKIREMCALNKYSFIHHVNIDRSCLNKSKIHLNAKGSALLAASFINFIRRRKQLSQINQSKKILDGRNITSIGSCTREGEKGDSLTFCSLIFESETLDSVQRNMYTTQFDNELDSSNLTCQSINISNRELETNITLHEGITSTSQHGSIDGSDRSPLHCIANIKGLKIACININSLYIDEIRFILMSSPLDVLAINESKLDHSITDGEIHIPGYVIIRKDRNRHGRGVALYIKNTFYTFQLDKNLSLPD